MTSHDVRDMLDLPGEAGPRPTKKQKISAPRPVLKGLAREVQNLGGDNPIAIVPEITQFKKKRFGSRKPASKWELRPFTNSAREDATLVLRHWRKKADVPVVALGEDENAQSASSIASPPMEDSTFSKFNVHVEVPSYTEEQYTTRLHRDSDGWTKDETDYLMKLARDYDLRWSVIWDRYDYQIPAQQMEVDGGEGVIVQVRRQRSMEELKARYYHVAQIMMTIHKRPEDMNGAEFNLLEQMRNYNPGQEIARKKFAEAAFHRTKEEAREEESLLLELKRILARSEKLSEERSELYRRLEAPPSTSRDHVYNTSAGLAQLIQQLLSVDKSKKRKSIMGAEVASPTVSGPNSAHPQSNYDRRDSTRESVSGPSSNRKEKEKQPPERRRLTPEEEVLFGVRYPDRLTSGPSFRSEKILKQITNKSNVQRQKVENVLNELGISTQIYMATWDYGIAFDTLIDNINLLLDQRKLAEKLQGEIDVLKALKAEREKKEQVANGEAKPGAVEGEGKDVPKGEEAGREKSVAPIVRPSSGHKRSASVLSAVSDKSTKRLKK